jgi:hypothetical protein
MTFGWKAAFNLEHVVSNESPVLRLMTVQRAP